MMEPNVLRRLALIPGKLVGLLPRTMSLACRAWTMLLSSWSALTRSAWKLTAND